MQNATCKMQRTGFKSTYNMQRAACNMQRAACNMQRAACNMQRAACYMHVVFGPCGLLCSPVGELWVFTGIHLSGLAQIRGDGLYDPSLSVLCHSITLQGALTHAVLFGSVALNCRSCPTGSSSTAARRCSGDCRPCPAPPRPAPLRCAVLCCAVLCCAVLCCAVLCPIEYSHTTP